MQSEPIITQLPDSKPATPEALSIVTDLMNRFLEVIEESKVEDDGLITSSIITLLMNVAYAMPHYRKRIVDGMRKAAYVIEEM